jgi:uncharacterized protein YceK
MESVMKAPMNKKSMVAVCGIMAIAGCSTVKTLNPPNDQISIYHMDQKSYCTYIPRIYSGVSYNFCKLRSEPSEYSNFGWDINGVPIVVIDTACSAVADTLVLAYTLPRQINEVTISDVINNSNGVIFLSDFFLDVF